MIKIMTHVIRDRNNVGSNRICMTFEVVSTAKYLVFHHVSTLTVNPKKNDEI